MSPLKGMIITTVTFNPSSFGSETLCLKSREMFLFNILRSTVKLSSTIRCVKVASPY